MKMLITWLVIWIVVSGGIKTVYYLSCESKISMLKAAVYGLFTASIATAILATIVVLF